MAAATLTARIYARPAASARAGSALPMALREATLLLLARPSSRRRLRAKTAPQMLRSGPKRPLRRARLRAARDPLNVIEH